MSKPVVNVKQGDLRGLEVESPTGGCYISFKGIPYATPPIGDLRFRDPQPPQPWTGVRDALTEGPKCAQQDIFTKTIIGEDDCLYLNVATKSLTGSRPVMVWIHGGGFIMGDGGSDVFGPDYIMDSGVVYVGINYRLGVLGFLHLDHEAAPGNIGLKDQVAALKWVKENIAQFGGDPNNVTIFGESAGGASVHYLLLSPLAKGLFHKAILQSGVAFNPFASTSSTVDMARRYVAALGKDITDPNEIVEFLRTVPVRRLIEVQENLLPLSEKFGSLILSFGPGVDSKSVEPFMPQPLRDLAEEGFDVPVMIGYTSHEGILFASSVLISPELREERYKALDKDFETSVLRGSASKSPTKVSDIAKKIRKFYFGDKRITNDLIDEYVQYHGDLHFLIGIHKVVEIQREKKSPTYFYRFSYDSPRSIAKTLFQVDVKGAMHAEELHYLFFATKAREMIKIEPDSTDDIVRERLVRMWTDFAKTGNPTPIIDDIITEKWEPVTRTKKNYLEIDAELSAGVNPNQDMWETWKPIYAIAEDD